MDPAAPANEPSPSSAPPPARMLPQPPPMPRQWLPSGPADKRLQWLVQGHYVLGGIMMILGVHLVLQSKVMYMLAGLSMTTEEVCQTVMIIGFFFLMIEIVGILIFLCGRRLAVGERLQFCQTTAFMECLIFPFGTVLGVCTFSALRQPRVRARFRS